MDLPIYLAAKGSGAFLLRVRVQPKASRSAFAGEQGDRLKVRIAAPPVDGAANEELLAFLKKALRPAGVRELALVRGDTSREKDVAIGSVTDPELLLSILKG